MKQKKEKKLAVYLTVRIVIVLFICLTALTITTATFTGKQMIKEQEQTLALLSKNNAAMAKAYLQNIVDKQDGLVASLHSLDTIPPELKNQYLLTMIHHAKEDEDTIASLYLVYAPNPAMPNGFTITGTDSGVTGASGVTAMITQDIYDQLAASTTVIVTDPYEKQLDGKTQQVLTVLSPVVDDATGMFIGAVGSDILTSVLNNASDYDSGEYESFYNLIISGTQTVVANTSDTTTVGKKYTDIARSKDPQLVLSVATDDSRTSFLDESKDGTKDYRACVPFYIGNSDQIWISTTSVSRADFVAPINRQIYSVVAIGLLTLIIIAVVALIGFRKTLKPIIELDRVAHEMSEGNLQGQLQCHSNDELGSLADSLRTSTTVLQGYVVDIDRAMNEMSRGNFDLEPTEPFIGDFENIEKSITRFIIAMSDTIHGINSVADQVAYASTSIAQGARDLAQGTSEQAASIEELSATLTDFETQVKNSAEYAENAKVRIDQAEDAVLSSNSKMQQLNTAIGKISEKSTEISKIIKTIEDIAFQTNILALNAAVEAARAGEAGKGFSVVADEVRNLASKSAAAAEDTNVLIEETVRAVEEGTKIADITVQSMVEVVEGTKAVTEMIDEITKTAEHQADSISQVNEGVNQISEVVQVNRGSSEESAASSQELSAQAQLLKEYVNRFQVKTPDVIQAMKNSIH